MKSRSIISATLAVGLLCLASSSVARANYWGSFGGDVKGCGGCEVAAPCCGPRVGLMDRLRSRCHQKAVKVDCCEPACGKVAPSCYDPCCAPRVGLMDRLRSRCHQKAVKVDCCEPACGKVAPSCCDPCRAPRIGLMDRLRARCHQKHCKVTCCDVVSDGPIQKAGPVQKAGPIQKADPVQKAIQK
jgi:hypothetical protein